MHNFTLRKAFHSTCQSLRFGEEEALLELTIRGVNHEKILNPGHDVMPTIVPAYRTRLQRLVIVFLALLNDPFEADVSTYVKSVMINRQQRKQA